MSKCTNCLSEKVCRYNDEHKLYYLYCKNDYVCPYFTDRSEWVHLPCKLGEQEIKIETCKEFVKKLKREVLPAICNDRFDYMKAEYEIDKFLDKMIGVKY